jgi:hypothetical protein
MKEAYKSFGNEEIVFADDSFSPLFSSHWSMRHDEIFRFTSVS